MGLIDVLTQFGFDAKSKARMARHKDTRRGMDFQKLLESEKFEDYQEWQSKEAYRDADLVASFVGDVKKRARFWGMYRVVGMAVVPPQKLPKNVLWPWDNTKPHNRYQLQRLPEFDPLADRLVIEWSNPRSWVQSLKNNTVVESEFAQAGVHRWDPVFAEGATGLSLAIRRYRSRIARNACLRIHRCRCAVCEMSFPETYNGLGVGFMHVHHLKAVSKRLGEYGVSARRDLRPVCPNCHAMLHWDTKEPRSIEELRQMMGKVTRV